MPARGASPAGGLAFIPVSLSPKENRVVGRASIDGESRPEPGRRKRAFGPDGFMLPKHVDDQLFREPFALHTEFSLLKFTGKTLINHGPDHGGNGQNHPVIVTAPPYRQPC